MSSSSPPGRLPLPALLARLRDVLLAQAEALSADDFDGFDRLGAEREQLTAQLGEHPPADLQVGDQALVNQIGALDRRLLTLTQAGLEQTRQELRDVHRGRGALGAYQRRGQNTIHGLARLDFEG